MFLRLTRREWLLFASLLLAFSTFKCLQHYSFQTSAYDLGVYTNVVWNLAHGGGFHSAINHRNQMGEHFSPIIALFTPFYLIWDSAYALLLAQALAVALAILLLYKLALDVAGPLPPEERSWLAWTCTIMSLFYLPLWSAVRADFHPSTLGMPMVAGALLCLRQDRMRSFWFLVALLLTTKEVALLSVVGLGLYAGLVLGKPRVMLTLFGVAALMALIVFLWVMPAFREQRAWAHYARLNSFSFPFLKARYLFLMAAYLGLMPLLGGRALFIVLPATLLNLLVQEKAQFSMHAHYDDQNCVFWIVAAMHGLTRFADWARRVPALRWNRPAVRIAIALGLALVAFGGSRQSIAASLRAACPNEQTRWFHKQLARYKKLPPEHGIITQDAIAPHLCHHARYIRLLDRSLTTPDLFKPGDYIVLSTRLGHYQLDINKVLAYLDANRQRFKRIKKDRNLKVYLVQ